MIKVGWRERPDKAGSIIAAKIAITQIKTNNSIKVNPLIFALVESIFMAAKTVTPPAPPTSAFFRPNGTV